MADLPGHEDHPSLTSGISPYPGSSAHSEALDGPARSSDVTTKSTVAIVLAILPFVVTWAVAVGLAISALRGSRQGASGRGMAVAALVVSGIWTALFVLLVAFANPAALDRDPEGGVTAAGDVRAEDLRTGDCLPGSEKPVEDGTDVILLEVVPCDESHREEVYADFELPDGDFPGADEVVRLAEGGCLRRFEEFAGGPLDDSPHGTSYIYPADARAWPENKGVSCLVVTTDPVRGSLEGFLAEDPTDDEAPADDEAA